ncbi:TetR family transcriptional regulator [Amycolatopsis sp. OK19-0408]|uniref:TetR family transcriptional regulator n=1 Tax=Amycolatopsis iheyensis TaxID=2945988 RepID=A0A9X2N6A7_9PSEU|nr:TetR family transcriptional regulator [Amycolatopsis iheyensis]MCR6483136.1 TetR family transcriptional regulator [Amycolatopsis iheyensis]
MSPPTGLRERKKYETHRALATAAVRLVAERGLDAVTVEDIATAADVSVRTFFNYFASKEDAVVIAVPDHLQRTERTIERFLALPAELSALAALTTAIRDDLAFIAENPREWLDRVTAMKRHPTLVHRSLAMNAEQIEPLTTAIARRTGCAPADLFPSLLLNVVSGALNAAMMRWHERDGEGAVADLFDDAVASIAAGLPDPKRTR